ncbi:MAG: hypothetical protein IJC65_02570 [Oscillospiraceae bacterium]|nr:hypothetical protein [Oscillospiraceae bacterium]
MAGNGYLRTVNFGGFDKKDVLAYVDELNTKIYNLETQLGEKNDTIAALEAGGAAAASGDFEGKEALEKKIEESHAKVSELMASTDSLKLQLTNLENEAGEKDSQIEAMKNEIEELKQKLEDAEANAAAGGGDSAAFDMGALFMEAKKSADSVVAEARKAAKKMEQEAKDLQDQILEDANAQAERIVNNANAEAKATTDNAQANAAALTASAQADADALLKNAREQEARITAQSKGLRDSVKTEFTELQTNVQKLSTVLNDLFGDSIVKLDSAKELVANGLQLVEGGSNFNYNLKGSDAQQVNKENNTKTVNNITATQSATTQSKPSFGKSLQFTAPAPDSVQLKAAKPEVKEEPKPEIKPEPKPVVVEEPKPVVVEEPKPVVVEEPKPVVVEEPKPEIKEEPKVNEGFHMAMAPKVEPMKEEAPVQAERKPASDFGFSMKKDSPKQEEVKEKTDVQPVKSAGASELRMGGSGKKSANPVNSRDMDMLAALAKEIQTQADDSISSLSDDDILNEWRKK